MFVAPKSEKPDGNPSSAPTASIASPAGDWPHEALPPLPLRRRRVPRRFFLGTFALYAMFLGTFLLSASSLHRVVPRGETVVPLLAGFSFYLVANLFLIILGRGNVSRWAVLACILCTLVLAAALCVTLRASLVYPALDPDAASAAREFLKRVAEVVRTYVMPAPGQVSYLKLVGMVCVEETLKLLPLIVLIALGRIRTAHAAMLCGVLSGLTFGIVESITFGYLEYPGLQSPITTYLTRFLVMGPQHAVWDALAGGIMFFVGTDPNDHSHRRPSIFAIGMGFAWSVIFHAAHNALQAMLGPFTQIATVFGLMMPLYMIAKGARKRSEAEGVDYAKQIVGDLHILTVALATAFLAGSVGFSRTAGRTARLLEDQWSMTEILRDLSHAKSQAEVEAARAKLSRDDVSSNDPELLKIHERILAAAETLAQSDRELEFVADDYHGQRSCVWGRDGVGARVLARTVACRAPYLLLDDCRLRLNRFAARRDLQPLPYKEIARWRVSVRNITLSTVAAKRCERDEPGERAAPDPYVVLASRNIHADPDKPEWLTPVARSERPMSNTLYVPFSPPWSAEATLWSAQAVLLIVDDDGSEPGEAGEILDLVDLPTEDLDGTLSMRDGSTVSLKLDFVK